MSFNKGVKMTRQQWRVIAQRAQALAHLGGTIGAIKYLREQTGCGLKEAYDATNALRALPLIKLGGRS